MNIELTVYESIVLQTTLNGALESYLNSEHFEKEKQAITSIMQKLDNAQKKYIIESTLE